MKGQGWRVILTQWRKASNILTSTLAAFLFSSHPKRESDREAHLNYYISRESQTTRNVLWSHVSVCLSVRDRKPTLLHGPRCNLGVGDAPSCALLGGFAIGAWVALLWQHYGNARQCPAVIHQAHRTHATHAHYACRRRLPLPVIKSTRLLSAQFHFVNTVGCCNANAKCSWIHACTCSLPSYASAYNRGDNYHIARQK